MIPRTHWFVLLLSGLFFLSTSSGEEKGTVRLLTIGNSFSRNATHHLDDLVVAAGHTLIHRPIIVGGASLELHAVKAQKHEGNPADSEGLYENGRSLKEELVAEPWDFVTIQQASIKSHDSATFRPDAPWLQGYLSRHAGGAQLLIHQTWAYRVDDPRFSKADPAPGEPKTQEEMYRGLTAAYTGIAAELGARVIPVGDAFFAADTDSRWGYRIDETFDFASAAHPALPRQTHSLHVGWRWTKAKSGEGFRLGMDGHHANLAGEYLGACVWFEVLFGESVVGNSYVPAGLGAEYARFLQETAHGAVQARMAVPAAN